jgi:hypothetical protein
MVMERLAIYLALHGAIVLTISLVAGLLLHKAIRLGRPVAAWHLAHAGVSSRGVMLMAIAAATRERGVTWGGSAVTRVVFALYVTSAMTVFPAALLLIAGLVITLQAS